MRCTALAALLLLAARLPAVPPPGTPDPDPEVERRTFRVADGFEVSLYAADPMLAKPVQMNFDSAGRLWVAASEVYPQVRPGQKPTDKILVLEDRDRDGKADKTTVFADGLLIPTGVIAGDGGAYVANSTELLHLSDTDGDGKADRTRVLLSGFGTEDTHHILHTLRWGADGQLYMHQSIYIHSHIETPHGPRRLLGGGVWMYRPETQRLEVFNRGLVNSWGHAWDDYGNSFLTDGAGGEGINYGLPGAAYTSAVGAPRVLQGLNPGSPKYCGLEMVGGPHLPGDWQGSLVTTDFRAHRVVRYTLREDGAGFASREMPEVIQSTHPAFRPIDVKMGPDGAIYVADWYNPIINHGEVDFRDPRRDKTHGRIWRVTAKGRPLSHAPPIVGAPVPALLDLLKSADPWAKSSARRELKERGPSAVVPELERWLAALPTGDAATERFRLEGLWLFQSLDTVRPELLSSLIRSPDHNVRAAAVRVAAFWHDRLPAPLELLGDRVLDEHPRVRLEAVRSLAAIPEPRAVELAMRALDRPVDRFLDYALWLTARELASAWLPALADGRVTFGGNAAHLLFALKATGTQEAVAPLVRLLNEGKVAPANEPAVLNLVATLGGAAEGRLVLARAASGSTPSALRAAALEALVNAARQKRPRPEGDLSAVLTLLDSSDERQRGPAARLVGLWKLEQGRDKLAAIAGQGGAGKAALDGLVALGGPKSRDALAALARSPAAPVRQAALVALLDTDAAAGIAAGVAALRSPDAGLPDAAAWFAAALARKDGGRLLADALKAGPIPGDAAKFGLRALRATGRADDALAAALTAAGRLDAPKRSFTPEESAALAADVARLGDPVRGEKLFRRADMQCLKCHGFGGAGGAVGPDMTSIGASAPVDYLVESMLNPNAKVKEGYNTLVVATDSDRVVTGIKVREGDGTLVLRDAENREVAVRTAEIESRSDGRSLMPEGLVDGLTRGELLDLVRFLSELGKQGPYALTQARLVRTWYTEAAPGVVYSRVSGELPAWETPSGPLAFEIDVTTPGPVSLRVGAPAGSTLTLEGKPVAVGSDGVATFDATAGVRTLTLTPGPDRSRTLRVELLDRPDSPARAAVRNRR